MSTIDTCAMYGSQRVDRSTLFRPKSGAGAAPVGSEARLDHEARPANRAGPERVRDHVMNEDQVLEIKHMAFAVRDVQATLDRYKRFLGVPADVGITEFAKSRNRVAIFDLGGVEYQVSQSMDADGRFASWIAERGGEGLHHICYAVADIDAALASAVEAGATLKPCAACQVTGSHEHPEGWVAFLADDVGGIEIEYMQVYTPEELERYQHVQGI